MLAHVTEHALTIRSVGGGAPGGVTVILLHGFGAPGDDLVDLAHDLGAPSGTRYLFPAAPLELAGVYGEARAWWMIDLDARAAQLPSALAAQVPDGLLAARGLVTALVERALADSEGALVLGGFSQGAMLALDTALHLPTAAAERLAGLLLFSGTTINGQAWAERLAQPDAVAGLPVLVSHGHADPLLAFSAAERLRDSLRGAGAAVEWVEFRGGHEIPRVALDGARRVLAAAAERGRRKVGAR